MVENRKSRERNQREADIVAAARKVFLEKGFEEASMDEIAREAEFTKPTLYQYFRDKESLYLAVALTGLQQMQEAVNTGLDPRASARESLLTACRNLLQFCMTNPGIFRMVGALSQVRPRSGADGTEERTERTNLAAYNDKMFADMAALISRAQQEGSISTSLDARNTAVSLLFLLTAFLNQLSYTGKTFSDHFSLDWDTFTRDTLNLILKSLWKEGETN